jgi:hypothetical protein
MRACGYKITPEETLVVTQKINAVCVLEAMKKQETALFSEGWIYSREVAQRLCVSGSTSPRGKAEDQHPFWK